MVATTVGRRCLSALALLALAALLLMPAAAGEKRSAKNFQVEPADLDCILGWTQVRNFRITNVLGRKKLEKAIKTAERQRGRYPVGTIIQLIPFEVMVRHRRKFSPETRGWEFLTLRGFRRFQLELDPDTGEPIIDTQGTTEVTNFLGGNCLGCHSKAATRFDLVCERDHGCDSLGPLLSNFTAEDFTNLALSGDPRCAELVAEGAE
jgi:hypothetical protein